MARRLGLITGIDVFCPGCGVSGSVREIVYAMPGSDFDFDNFIVVGRCVTDNDPDIGCMERGWLGTDRDMTLWANY